MRREINERDLPAIALRRLGVCWQKFRNGIGQRHFAVLDHVREQQRREDLRDRSNLEDRVAVEFAWIALVKCAVRDDPSSFWTDNADDDADALMKVVNPLHQNLAEVGVGRKGSRRGFLLARGDPRGDQPGGRGQEHHKRQSKSRHAKPLSRHAAISDAHPDAIVSRPPGVHCADCEQCDNN